MAEGLFMINVEEWGEKLRRSPRSVAGEPLIQGYTKSGRLVGLSEEKVVRPTGVNNLLKGPEKQIPRRAKALLVMTKL
jgi:hypothetical protein